MTHFFHSITSMCYCYFYFSISLSTFQNQAFTVIKFVYCTVAVLSAMTWTGWQKKLCDMQVYSTYKVHHVVITSCTLSAPTTLHSCEVQKVFSAAKIKHSDDTHRNDDSCSVHSVEVDFRYGFTHVTV